MTLREITATLLLIRFSATNMPRVSPGVQREYVKMLGKYTAMLIMLMQSARR